MTDEYIPLTKKIIGDDGQEEVVCRYYGTDLCQKIYKPDKCGYCPMMTVIIRQLNVFEEVYMEE